MVGEGCFTECFGRVINSLESKIICFVLSIELSTAVDITTTNDLVQRMIELCALNYVSTSMFKIQLLLTEITDTINNQCATTICIVKLTISDLAIIHLIFS